MPEEKLIYPSNEWPCFTIREIVLEGEAADKFQWALAGAAGARGRCLGSQGFNTLMGRMQNLIMGRGYVTTRLTAGPQDLTSGRLVLTLVPGRVRAVRLDENSDRLLVLQRAMPVRPGGILNVRDIEQGLENLRRPPNVTTDIQILPGEKEGESDVVVTWKRGRPLRFSFGVDDSGSRHTGRMRGTATFSFDNIAGFSDLFYASFSHNLESGKDYGTQGHSFHYSLPWGYNLLALSSNYYTYHQMVAGRYVNYEYSGQSRDTALDFSRLIYRGAKSKTTLGLSAFVNSSRSFIDRVELEIQRRRMAGWEAFLNHRHYLGDLTLDAEFRFRRGTGAFKSLRCPEEDIDEGTSRPTILSFNLRGQYPLQLAGQKFRYVGQGRFQRALDKLVSRDRFSIGGRYSVRGYDGDMTLSGDNGLVFRQELGWAVGGSGQELYAAFDVGRVWGPFDEYLLGKTLSGAALGLRGAAWGFNYDVFVSGPVSRPESFPGSGPVTGFSLVWSF